MVTHDLGLMEREGSGYDVIYEELLVNGKPLPIAEELDDRVRITIRNAISRPDVVSFINRVQEEFQLTQKEKIALGLIAQHQSLSAVELSRTLDLQGNNPSRSWVDRLVELKIIEQQGRGKGTEYYVNPLIVRRAKLRQKTGLRLIEPYRLRELIYADLKMYPNSSLADINGRIGPDIPIVKIRAQLRVLMQEKSVQMSGRTRSAVYSIVKKDGEKQN